MGFSYEDVQANLSLLQELLTCGFHVYTWRYDKEGQLMETNCPNLVIDKMFAVSGSKEYLLTHVSQSHNPLILSAGLGMLWGAAFYAPQDTVEEIYLIGPVFNTTVSQAAINDTVSSRNIPLRWRSTFQKILDSLPVISSITFFQYVLMLHYCLTGEKLSRGDLHFQQDPVPSSRKDKEASRNDRHQTWLAEQALLANVREGNLHFQTELERAGMLSNGVNISADTPIMQARLSETIFVSLCTRAAIEGGMSPDTAYTLGDSYIQSLMACHSFTEMKNIGHTMYEDFICRVHALHEDVKLSPEIQACRDYIEMHAAEPLSLEFLAGRVGYAPYYLSRKFKKETGCGINDYIRKIRIEQAKRALTYSDDSIGSIAEKLQFCSASHFAEVFQKSEHMLPQEYRKQTRKP